jgi:hypothetical protein
VNALKCGGTGSGKLHSEPCAAKVTPEVLAKQHLDIRLVVDHENEQAHTRPFDLLSAARFLYGA